MSSGNGKPRPSVSEWLADKLTGNQYSQRAETIQRHEQTIAQQSSTISTHESTIAQHQSTSATSSRNDSWSQGGAAVGAGFSTAAAIHQSRIDKHMEAMKKWGPNPRPSPKALKINAGLRGAGVAGPVVDTVTSLASGNPVAAAGASMQAAGSMAMSSGPWQRRLAGATLFTVGSGVRILSNMSSSGKKTGL